MNSAESVWRLIGKKPLAACVAALLVVLQSVLGVAQAVVLERFIDGFSSFGWEKVFLFAAAIAGIFMFGHIQAPAVEYLKGKIRLQLRAHLDGKIIDKTARVSMEALEEPENQALLARLRDEPEKRYTEGFFAILQILGGTLGTAGVLALVMDSVPLYLFVLLPLLGLMVAVFRLLGNYRVKLYHSRQEIGRRSDYLSGILFDRRLAQEKKLFGYTPYIQKLYEEENIRSGRRMYKSIGISNAILWIYDNIVYLFSASAYLVFLFPLYQGKINVGFYVAMIPALAGLGSFFVAAGSVYLPTYQEYKACRRDVEKLGALPEQYYDARRQKEGLPRFHVIKGEKVVFGYPGQEKPVLDGLDFTFYAGKNYALVGENGCGKSTLIKLLMGFYRPKSGTITIDGQNIQEMDFGKLQGYFSAVFQDYTRYDYTVGENIFLSCPGRKAREKRMREAAGEAGLDRWIESCPEAYDTKLGNLETGGSDLSGGQWQRLSIARMLYRPADIRIWDEPTAAMDPLAESRLYTDFLRKRSEGCVNVFVTHRLGAAVGADEICVLKEGKFAEQGTHAQLMEKEEGLYRRMFEAQKGMYE